MRALVLLMLAACSDGPEQREHAQGDASVGGDTVATVDGIGITTGDVVKYAEESGEPLRASLDALERFELLAAEAERRGLGSDRSVEQGVAQAMVQLLLEREVEAPTANVEPAAIARAYEAHRDRYVAPETRVSTHLLVRLDESASPEQVERASTFVRGVIARAKASTDPYAVFNEYNATMQHGRPIVVEQLPAFPRDGGLVRPFLDAMFSLSRPGVVDAPVRTQFGVHAIWVSEIRAERAVPLEEVRDALADEVRLERRQQRLAALVARLTETYEPTRDEAAIAAAVRRSEPER